MRDVVRALVTPTHAGQRRRIVAGRVLREAGGVKYRVDARDLTQQVDRDRAASPHRHAVEKIAPRDRTIHAEIAIGGRFFLL